MLGVKKNDCTKKMAIFWVTRPVKFAALKYGTYKFWTIKVDCKIDSFDEFKNYLKTKDIFD